MHFFTILYVQSVPASVEFYGKILGVQPTEFHPTFASFALPDGHMLGLWGAAGVQPPTDGTGARSELCFDFPDRPSLENARDSWLEAGAKLIQDLTVLDFGDTFTVTDPDGHRLRAMIPRAE
jgi:predicted enzyme related to lactoylglutathione lyase